MIIIAAAGTIDLDVLNSLVQQYDVATTDAERERIAKEVERLTGDKARSAVRQRLGNFGLSQDEIDSLATESIDLALRGVGRVHLRRSDVVPEELVRQMTTTAQGQRLFELLSADLKQALQAPYLKQGTENLLIRELNDLLDRDLAQELSIPGPPASPSAIQRTFDNAQLLASAFPGAVDEIKKPPPHFMGYLTKNVIPTLGQRVRKEKGTIPDEVARTWRAIRPIVEDLQASSGGSIPTAAEVRQEWLERMNSRYNAALEWWNVQLRKVGRPFRVDHNSFADAKDVLIDRGYDPSLWEGPNAQYHLPKDFLKPFSTNAIERAMAYQQRPTNRPLPTQPAAPEESGTEAPSWAVQMGQEGRGGELYRAILEMVYTDPSSIQREVGGFMATHPNPSQGEIDQFLASLDERHADSAPLIRRDWDMVVRAIDSAVVRALADERIMSLVSDQFGFSSSRLEAMRDGVRRVVFGRTARAINRRFARHGRFSSMPVSRECTYGGSTRRAGTSWGRPRICIEKSR